MSLRRHCKGGKADAEKLRDELVAHLWNGTLPTKRKFGTAEHGPRVPTLDEFIPVYLEHVGPSVTATERHRKKAVLALWAKTHGTTPLDQIGQTAIDATVKELQFLGRANQTINNRMGELRRLLDCAARLDVLPKIPKIHWPKYLKHKERLAWLTQEQVSKLLAPQLGIMAQPLYRTLFLLGVHAGLRIGEIRALRWCDVDLENRMLTIRWQVVQKNMLTPPKNKKIRVIPITDQLYQALADLKAGPSYEFVIWSDTSPKIPRSYETIARWWKNALLITGLWDDKNPEKDQLPRDATPHCWRHTFATHLARAGVPAATLQDLLGHETITQSARYVQRFQGDNIEAIRKLSALNTI
jgi:integrase